MLPKKFLEEARAFMYAQSEKYGMPSHALNTIAYENALRLAKQVGADPDIVCAGALLMDCQLGQAAAEGRIQDHMVMAVDQANQLMDKFPEIDHQTRGRVLVCIREHHGAKRFSSLEAEACCNGDCYKFASIEGFFMAIRFTRDLSTETLLQILHDKVEEKWQALSLNTCKQELGPQYELLKQFLAYLPPKPNNV